MYKMVYVSRVEGQNDLDLGQALVLEGKEMPLLYWRYDRLEENYKFEPVPGTSGGLTNRGIVRARAEEYARENKLPLYVARNYAGQPDPANEIARQDVDQAIAIRNAQMDFLRKRIGFGELKRIVRGNS